MTIGSTATSAPASHGQLFIGGEWVEPATSRQIEVVSPTTEQVIGSVPEAGQEDVDRAVAAARRAFDDPNGWSHWEPSRRAEVLERFAAAMESRQQDIATAVSSQNGMPIQVSGPFEGGFPPLLLRYYAELIRNPEFHEERRPAMFGGTTLVRREPVGVVAAIVPWNFPQALAFTKLAPALAAGCTVVMKPSPETVLDSYIMSEAAAEAGLPAGVINIVPADRAIGSYLVSHPGIDKIGFTGSTAAGRSIAEACGRLLRPVTLELGGKSAAIVLDDADLTTDPASFLEATLMNNGQTCFVGTRVLVPRRRYQEYLDTVSDLVGSLRVGDPLDPETQVGPLVSARQRERVQSYIDQGRSEGGQITIGGGRPAGLDRGFFVEPTVFGGVDNNHTIAREEIFGPVLAVIPFDSEDDAVRIANDSDFGLGGSVWSADRDRAVAVARRVRTGSIGINSYKNDPFSPFGGVKASGMGREQGPEGLDAYYVIKSVYGAP